MLKATSPPKDMERVKRYTTLASALDILLRKRLTLLNPRTWDDDNDSYFLELHRRHVQAGSILALCFTMERERYHHWKVFADGIEGVCIEFDRENLERALPKSKAYSGPVDYETFDSIANLGQNDVASLPFIKRFGYTDEREWRVLAARKDENLMACHIPIKIEWVDRVILSPWMPEALRKTVKEIIHTIEECENLRVTSSTLTNSPRWQREGARLIDGDKGKNKKKPRR